MTNTFQPDLSPALPVRDPSHSGMIAAQRLSIRDAQFGARLSEDDAALLPLVMSLARLAARQHVGEAL